MRKTLLLFVMGLLGGLIFLSQVQAGQSDNFMLMEDRFLSGFGSGDSPAFTGVRGLVGQSGAGGVSSANFSLDFGGVRVIRPPGGNGTTIEVKGTTEDPNASVVVQALNSVTAVVSGGTWEAKGVRVAEGPNTVVVTATGRNGKSTVKEIHITVDTIPPARPTLKAVVTPTPETPQTLSGTKDPGTGIWLNGIEVVPADLQANWSYVLPLVQGRNPLDLWTKDRARNSSTHVVTQIVYDATPPTTPVVTDDGRSTVFLNQLHASWVAQEDATQIVNYAYAIGTSAGGSDLVPFTDVGTQTEVTRTGLSLGAGVKYYFTVKATNTVGLVSAPGSSDGIRVNTQPPAITAVAPAPGSRYYPPALVTSSVTAVDPSGDPLEYRFKVDGQVVQDWSSSSTYPLNTSAFPSGLRTLRIEVQDPFDGEDSRSVQLYLYRKPIQARE